MRALAYCGAVRKIRPTFARGSDEAIFSIALSEAEGSALDKSAPQQTSRYLGFNNQLQVININLAIQSQNKCPPRKNGINPFRHGLQARECLLARLKKDETSTSKCDFKSWRLE
jgi:hypothetical protein